MIYVTGDTHGDIDRFKDSQMKKLGRGDTLIICGDFGFFWDGSKKEQQMLKKLAAKVDGSVGRMAFLAVVTSAGYAYRRPDGVYVVPASCLAP